MKSIVTMFAAFALIACEKPTPKSTERVKQEQTDVKAEKPEELVEQKAPGNTAVANTVVKIDSQIEFFQQRLKTDTAVYLDAAKLISAYSARFRLSGRVEDLANANSALIDAKKRFKDPEVLQHAFGNLHSKLHQPVDAKQALERALKIARLNEERANIIGQLGELDLQNGLFEAALEKFEKSRELAKHPGTAIRLSSYYQKRGEWDQAIEWADVAVEESGLKSKLTRAFALLLRGIIELERGEYKAALAFYEDANEAFDGWYLVEEHIAEIYAIQERWEEAKKMYTHVLSRVPSGQFYDALAGVEEKLGNDERAKTLSAKALEKLKTEVELLPAAMGGHALDVALESNDLKFALDLAEKNHEKRPMFESKVKLAQAYLKADRANDALKTLEPVIGSNWNTVDSNVTIAMVYEKLDQSEKANQYLARAEKIRPGSSKE